MKKTVSMFECDICDASKVEEDRELFETLPSGWALVITEKSDGKKTEVLLCIGCHIALGNALGERLHINAPKKEEVA